MIKYFLNLLVLTLLLSSQSLLAQRDRNGLSAGCHVNANGRSWAAQFDNQKDATVRIDLQKHDGTYTRCSATLINQVTRQLTLRQVIVLSRHCFATAGGLSGNVDVDFGSNDHFITFHYQSPDASSISGPQTNQGTAASNNDVSAPSALVATNASLARNNGYHFTMRTSLTRLAENKWGDYALLEINEPIPPQFYPYFAGYQTRTQGVIDLGNPLTGYHHPRGDLKKLVKSPFLVTYDPHTHLCKYVTQRVDFFFGWIWGNSSSTRRICRHTAIPWYSAVLDEGVTESGSSGSGIFSKFGNHVGPLSGLSIGGCSGGVTHYTRNSDHYFDTDIRNVLNPQRDFLADYSGYSGTRRTCYTNLNLHGFFWPHADHSQNGENHVLIRANGTVNLAVDDEGANQVCWIARGSDYTVESGSGIFIQANQAGASNLDHNENFFAATGSNLSLVTSNYPCDLLEKTVPNSSLKNSPIQHVENRLAYLNSMQIPIIPQDKNRIEVDFAVYPNPSKGRIILEWKNRHRGEQAKIYSLNGQLLKVINLNQEHKEELDLRDLNKGVYYLSVVSDEIEDKRVKILLQ